jgi:cell division septation protein DedD
LFDVATIVVVLPLELSRAADRRSVEVHELSLQPDTQGQYAKLGHYHFLEFFVDQSLKNSTPCSLVKICRQFEGLSSSIALQ